jgi:predicted Rossmann fold nucleotide-binding protein DprA/Smf involved in DNA uptake
MAEELSKPGLQDCSGLASGIDSKEHEGRWRAE